MRFTREPIPPTFNGRPTEYKLFGAFRDLGFGGKAVYAVAAFLSGGMSVALLEGMTLLGARHTARKSLSYKHELENAIPQGHLPQKGLVPEYSGYAQEIAQSVAQVRAATPQPSYMGVAHTSELSQPSQNPGAFEQRVRTQQPAGSRSF